jgi:hypothetical protein
VRCEQCDREIGEDTDELTLNDNNGDISSFCRIECLLERLANTLVERADEKLEELAEDGKGE